MTVDVKILGPTTGGTGGNVVNVDSAGNLAVSLATGTSAPPLQGPFSDGSVAALSTVGTQVLGTAASRRFLMIQNVHGTNSVAIRFGTGTPALNTQSSLMIPPLGSLTFSSGFVNNDAIQAIASGTATPVTIYTA